MTETKRPRNEARPLRLSDRVDSTAMNTLRLTRRQFGLAAAGAALAGARLTSAQAASPPYVVDPAWLQSQLASNQNLVVLDVSPLRTYHDSHVESAVHCWWQDTMELNNPVYG